MYAPYAQAAAMVATNSTLLAAKNVESSRRVATGQYCVKVSDPDIDLATSAVHVTANAGNWAAFMVSTTPGRSWSPSPSRTTSTGS